MRAPAKDGGGTGREVEAREVEEREVEAREVEAPGAEAPGAEVPGAGDQRDAPEFEAPWDRSLYPHPEWTVGLVLVAAGITLLFGLLVDPIWLLVGSPFLIVLVLWIWVRFVALPRRERALHGEEAAADAGIDDVETST